MNHLRLTIGACILVSTFPVIASADEPQAIPIKDNSFLIEEAYNQEAGVVQHIVTVQHFASPNHFWGLAYTQEIPMFGMRHQLSWTVPFVSVYEWDNLGIGDIAVHYRLQAMDGANGVAISPRLSVFLPSGDENRRGEGVVSWQANLPISIDLNRSFVLHLNGGATLVPNRGFWDYLDTHAHFEHDLTSFNVGGSLVWLSRGNVNLLCEIVHNDSEEIVSARDTDRFNETIVNPGIRFAINKPFGQFVPGIGMPIRFSDGETDFGVFGYFSFEHSL